MRCDVIRFVAFEDLGIWEPEIRAHGYQVRYLDAGVDDVAPFADADLGICLGAPIDADDEAHFPYLADVRDALAARLAADRPTLGICLGAQLMSLALGGELARGNREVGWGPVVCCPTLWRLRFATSPGRRCCIGIRTWRPCPTARPSSRRPVLNPNQAFSYGRSLAFQFHPEADPGGDRALAHRPRGRPERLGLRRSRELREQAREHGDAAAMAGVSLIREYLRSL